MRMQGFSRFFQKIRKTILSYTNLSSKCKQAMHNSFIYDKNFADTH